MWKSVLASVAVAVLAHAAPASDGGKIPWNKDPAAAIKAAKTSGRAMMMFFTSDG